MAEAPATAKRTGGCGYSFEDKVAARYPAMMLVGGPGSMSSPGTFSRSGFRTEATAGCWLGDTIPNYRLELCMASLETLPRNPGTINRS